MPQPAFVYDHRVVDGSRVATRAAYLPRMPSSPSSGGSNSSAAESGIGERLARRSATDADLAHAAPPSSGTCSAIGSPSDSRPASASRTITVATMDLVREPAPKRDSILTGAPDETSATPYCATVTAPPRNTPMDAPGTP